MNARHGAGHRRLYVDGSTPIHRLAPEAKLLGLVGFVVTVAVTPRQWVGAFALDLCIVAATAAAARLRPALVVRRLATILPFVAFAGLLPFIGDGPTVAIGPLSLSVDGLWASWNVLSKAAIGATAAIVVTATTPIPDLLSGLSRLRVPAAIVGIIGFMFRYLDLIVDESSRMRRAMAARGHAPRWFWQNRALAASAGTLFVRTYERGERVHGAMVARGYLGTMPNDAPGACGARQWLIGLVPAAGAVAGFALAALA